MASHIDIILCTVAVVAGTSVFYYKLLQGFYTRFSHHSYKEMLTLGTCNATPGLFTDLTLDNLGLKAYWWLIEDIRRPNP